MDGMADITKSFINYLQFEKRYSVHTIIAYRTDLAQFSTSLNDSFDLQDPTQATFQMIRNWLHQLAENKCSTRSINRKIACIRSFYKFLFKKGLVIQDPTQKIIAPKNKKLLPVFVEEKAIQKLLNDFKYPEGWTGLRDKVIIEMLYGTGIRLSELIGLQENAISLGSATIKVLGKGKKERIIPLNKSLLELINVYIAAKAAVSEKSASFIVTDKGEAAYPVFIYRIVNKYLSMITAIEKKSPHVLRHTFATHLLNKGADLNAIKELLGHSSLAATQVYTHNTFDKIKAIFDQAHPKA